MSLSVAPDEERHQARGRGGGPASRPGAAISRCLPASGDSPLAVAADGAGGASQADLGQADPADGDAAAAPHGPGRAEAAVGLHGFEVGLAEDVLGQARGEVATGWLRGEPSFQSGRVYGSAAFWASE